MFRFIDFNKLYYSMTVNKHLQIKGIQLYIYIDTVK